MLPCLLQTFHCTSVFQLSGMGIPWYVFIIVLMSSTTITLCDTLQFLNFATVLDIIFNCALMLHVFLSVWFCYVKLSLWILTIWMYKGHVVFFLLCKINCSHLSVPLWNENTEFFALISHDLHLYVCQKMSEPWHKNQFYIS